MRPVRLLPHSQFERTSEFSVRLPAMRISEADLWQLAGRMSQAMGQPTYVLVADGPQNAMGEPGSRILKRHADAGFGGKDVAGLLLTAVAEYHLQDGMGVIASAQPGMDFNFGREHPPSGGLFGSTNELWPFVDELTGIVEWLQQRGRYRWGYFLPLLVGTVLLVATLVAGLVFTAVITARGDYAAITVVFTSIVGIAGIWGIAMGAVRLIRAERARHRGVVVAWER